MIGLRSKMVRFSPQLLLLLVMFVVAWPNAGHSAQVENFNLTGMWTFEVSGSDDATFNGEYIIIMEQYGAFYKAKQLDNVAYSIYNDVYISGQVVLNRYDDPTATFWEFDLNNITDGKANGYAYRYVTDGARHSGTLVATRVDYSINYYDQDYTLFIPHLTGADPFWSSYVSVSNNTNDSQAAAYRLILYDENGVEVFRDRYTVAARKTVRHDIATLASNAAWGEIQMLQRGLDAKLTFQNEGGGLSQFTLSPFTTPKLAFNFSNDFPDYVVWKGLALANTGTDPILVNLSAVKDGAVVGQVSVTLGPKARTVGTSQTWFPSLDTTDFDSIIASSTAGALAGLAISGDYSGLHFISAASAYAPYY